MPTPLDQHDSGNKLFPAASSIQAVGGLVAVVVGVSAITALAVAAMAFISNGKDANSMIPLATAAFGVISAVVGAYLGIKIGTDQSASSAQDAKEANAKLTAVQGFIPAEHQEDAQKAAAVAVSNVVPPKSGA